MNAKGIILLVAAVSAAGSTGLFAKNYLDKERAEIMSQAPREAARQQEDQQKVLVVAENLSLGTFIKAEHLRWQVWPKDGVVEGYIKKETRKIEDFVGGVVRTSITDGQPFTESLIVKPGERGFLAAVLKPGSRAVSVSLNATSGIAGFVFPGDHVDLILTTRLQTETGESDGIMGGAKKQTNHFSETLLEKIRVLAIDQNTHNQEGKAKVAKTATLEVTPKQVEIVALGREIGSISLSLRSLAREGEEKEKSVARGSYTMDRDVYYMLDRVAPQRKTRVAKFVDVVRGNNSNQVMFK